MKRLSIGLIILVVFAALSVNQTANPAMAIGFGLPEGARRITPAELQELIKQDQAIIVDVRSEEAYKAGHIKGAILIPAPDIAKRVDELPRDKLIATYCAWPAENSSAGAVLQLNAKGLKNAAAVLGGYAAMLKAGFEKETGNER